MMYVSVLRDVFMEGFSGFLMLSYKELRSKEDLIETMKYFISYPLRI